MVDHFLLLKALRNRLKSLVVATTGTTSLEATAEGYTRPAGSFLTDGFVPGMEVQPSGFANNTPGIVAKVEAARLVIEGGRTAETLVSGRSLVVGLPGKRAWENMPFAPEDGRWYVEEDYLPGPVARATLGKNNFETNVDPLYVLRLYGISGKGVHALFKVSDGILKLFYPNLEMLVEDGHILRVKSDPAPDRGQVLPEGASHALVVISVPLWVRATNTI